MGQKTVLNFELAQVMKRSLPSQKIPFLLSIGRNVALLAERHALLQDANYRVRSATPEMLSEIPKEEGIVVLFCFTLAQDERVFLASSFRRYSPESRLVLVTQGGKPEQDEVLFHSIVRSEDGSRALLQAVRQLSFAA